MIEAFQERVPVRGEQVGFPERQYFFYLSGNPTSRIEQLTDAGAPFKPAEGYSIFHRPLQLKYKCSGRGMLFVCEEINWRNLNHGNHKATIARPSFSPSLKLHNLPHDFSTAEEAEIIGDLTEFLEITGVNYVLLSQSKAGTRVLEGNPDVIAIQDAKDRAYVPGVMEATTIFPLAH